jgi:hypothetical protein
MRMAVATTDRNNFRFEEAHCTITRPRKEKGRLRTKMGTRKIASPFQYETSRHNTLLVLAL